MRSIRDILNITTTRDRTRASICSAIKSRRVIEFYYHGGFRTVEPFCLGLVLTGDADNESLLCYQVGGYCELREPTGWKLYRASEIEDVEITGELFSGNRPDYDPTNVEMVTIYCCVSPGTVDDSIMKDLPEAEKKADYEVPREPSNLELTHNQLMRRFRFTHPVPLPDLYTNILA